MSTAGNFVTGWNLRELPLFEAAPSHRRCDRLLIHAPAFPSQFRCVSGCHIVIVRIRIDPTDLCDEAALRPRTPIRTCRTSFHRTS